LKNETQIVDNLTTDLDLSMFHDGYKERIDALIKSKMKGEVAQWWRRNLKSLQPRA